MNSANAELTGSFVVLPSDSECLSGSAGSMYAVGDDDSVTDGVIWISAAVSPL